MNSLSISLSLIPMCFSLCYYVNYTSQIQVARISQFQQWHFERIIFPGQRLLFEAPLEAWLEIYTSELATAVLHERISCRKLQVSPTDSLGQNNVNLFP